MVTGNTETRITVTYEDADGTVDFVVDDDLANYDNTNSAFLTAEVDGSTSNELQNLFQTFNASSGTDPVADGQTDTLNLTGGSGITVTGDATTDTITIASTVTDTDTDDQTIDVFSLASDILSLSLEDDGEATKTIDLSAYLDNTDDQTIDTFSIATNTLSLSLEDDGEAAKTVDLSPYLDNTDTQDLTLTGNTLAISGDPLSLIHI